MDVGISNSVVVTHELVCLKSNIAPKGLSVEAAKKYLYTRYEEAYSLEIWRL